MSTVPNICPGNYYNERCWPRNFFVWKEDMHATDSRIRVLFENENYPTDVEKALTEVFHQVDEEFLKISKSRKFEDGSTGIVALLLNDTIYVANAGDSRGMTLDGVVLCKSRVYVFL